MCCYSGDEQPRNHMKNFVVNVLNRLKREIDSVKSDWFNGSWRHVEPNVLELCEYPEELQDIDNVSGVRLDPELLSASRKVDIGFMNRLVDVNARDAKRPVPRTFALMGPFECVMFLLSKALMWNPGASGASVRKILSLDTSREHCQADATSEMAVELPLEEQEKGEDLIKELLKSLYGTRKAAHNWKK